MQTQRKQSHNLTPQELQELQTKQMEGTVEMVKANKDSSVEIPEHDQHLIHASIEAPQYDQQSGVKQSIEQIQTFYPAEFASMEKDNAFSGKVVRIVHLPDGVKANDIKDQTSLLGAQKAAGVIGATGDNTGVAGDDAKGEKPLAKMKKEELAAKYKLLWNEESGDLTNAQMISAIQEKIDDLANEQIVKDQAAADALAAGGVKTV